MRLLLFVIAILTSVSVSYAEEWKKPTRAELKALEAQYFGRTYLYYRGGVSHKVVYVNPKGKAYFLFHTRKKPYKGKAKASYSFEKKSTGICWCYGAAGACFTPQQMNALPSKEGDPYSLATLKRLDETISRKLTRGELDQKLGTR